MSKVRKRFVEDFGEDAATKIESAAASHRNAIHDNPGSDPFKWALCIVIGHQCVELDSYREYHGITTPSWKDFRNWVKIHGELESHDGDVDFLSLFCGTYDEFMPGKLPQA